MTPALQVPVRDPCPFCEDAAGRYAWHGPPAVVVDDDVIRVFLAPAALGGEPGHALVIPHRHVETIFDLSHDEAAALGVAVVRTARAVRDAFDPEGILVQQCNGVAAFQTVPHVHVHVIPERADRPFPPTEEVPVIPNEERVEQAACIRARWR